MRTAIIQALGSVTPAAIAAGVIMLLARMRARQMPVSATAAVTTAPWLIAALTAALCTAVLSLVGWRLLLLQDRWHWLLPAGLAAGGCAWAFCRPGRIRLFAVITASAVVPLLLRPIPSLPHAGGWQAVLGALIAIMGWLAAGRPEQPHRWPHIPWMALFLGLSALILATSFVGLSLVAGSMASACIAFMLLSPAAATHQQQSPAVLWMQAMLAECILAVAWMYRPASSPSVAFMLAAAAPFPLLMASRISPAAALFSMALITAAAVMAWTASPPDPALW